MDDDGFLISGIGMICGDPSSGMIIKVNCTVDEPTSWMAYSIDGQDPVIIAGNTTLYGLSEGPHNLKVYAKDTA